MEPIYTQLRLERFSHASTVADVGIWDSNDEWGEEVKAVVELNKDYQSSDELLAELMNFAQENLAKMKLPRSIDCIEKLPRDENGKLYKEDSEIPTGKIRSSNV